MGARDASRNERSAMVMAMARRGLLVVNPTATSTTRGTRLVLERALRSALNLDVAETQQRGDGARVAAASDHDVIVVLGGDGTVNDVTTGLIDFTSGKSRGPQLAVVPGGSTNVFARAIGMPSDPIEATEQLLGALEADRIRTLSIGGLSVGELPERTFLFAAGMGVDGQTVAMMEKSRRPFGLSPLRYAAASLLSLSRMRPELSVFINGSPTPIHAAIAIATTNRVWTYFGSKPLSLTPQASFDSGLGLFALEHLDLSQGAQQFWALATSGVPGGSGAKTYGNLTSIAITAPTPLPVQADGEALGSAMTIRLRSLDRALNVLA